MDWNNINEDRDTSGLGPIEYDQSKVPSLIRKHADNVRGKSYGQQVREAQARNAEYAGLIASEAVDISNETKGRQDKVETQFNSVQQELTDKDPISAPEIIAARNGEATLSERLDKEQQEVNAQLAENTNNIHTKEINAKYPPVPMVGIKADGVTDDTTALKNLINSLDENGVLRVPDGTILFTELAFKDRTTIKGSGIDNTTFKYIGVQGGKALSVPYSSGRQYYTESSGFTIDCDNLANIGLDLSNISYSSFSNILILNPRNAGVMFDSSQRGTYWDTPTVYNVLTNVFVYVNENVTSFEKGFAFTGGSNSHRLINCRTTSEAKTGIGFSIDDERDNNNLFIGCNAEGINTAFYINGEFNTILSPRIEVANKGIEFGTDEKARNNTVINPAFYTTNTKYVNVKPNKTNTIIDPSEGGDKVFNNLVVRPQAGNSLIETWTGREGSLALRNMGSTRVSFQESVNDDSYKLRSVKNGEFRTAFSVSNTEFPFLKADNGVKTYANTTVNRPAFPQSGLYAGYMMFDTTLDKPIWYNGGRWLDATGTQV